MCLIKQKIFNRDYFLSITLVIIINLKPYQWNLKKI